MPARVICSIQEEHPIGVLRGADGLDFRIFLQQVNDAVDNPLIPAGGQERLKEHEEQALQILLIHELEYCALLSVEMAVINDQPVVCQKSAHQFIATGLLCTTFWFLRAD